MEKGHRCGYSRCARTALLSLEDVGNDSVGGTQDRREKRNRTLEFCFTNQRDFSLGDVLRTFDRLSVVYSHLFRVSHAVQIRHARLSANEIGRASGIEGTGVLRVVERKFAEGGFVVSPMFQKHGTHFLASLTCIPRAVLKERYVT